MQKHRIFIAINLPEDVKNKLVGFQKKIAELFSPLQDEFPNRGLVRWTKKENLHITLEFIGYVNNDELLKIIEVVKRAAEKNRPFSVKITKICYGPWPPKFPEITTEEKERKQKFGWPRMIWAVGEKSKEFASLRDDLKKFLSEFPANRQNPSASRKERKFSPHITLGRIRQWQWRRIEPEERPAIEQDINLNFSVDSIEVMESRLKRGGPEYAILTTYNLKLKL
jgi:2'-5' RNA ligase